MSGCGYVCPVCEGSGMDDEGNACTWCTPIFIPFNKDEDKNERPFKNKVDKDFTDSLGDINS